MKKLVLGLIVLSGCQSGYKAPDKPMPTAFIQTTAQMNEKEFVARFWENLEDPLLNQLVELVMTQNYDFLTAKEKIGQLRAQYNFQTSQLYPQIGMLGNINREKISETLSDSPFLGAPYQTLYQLGFDASWEIDFFGAQKAAKEGAFFSMMSQVEQTAFIKLSLVSELILQYVNLRTFQALKQNYQAEVEVLKKIEAISNERFQKGLDDRRSSWLNLARIQDKQALIKKTGADIDKLIYLITQLTGQFPEAEATCLKNFIPLKAELPLIYSEIPSKIVLQRPDVAAARWQLFSTQALLKKAYRDFFPQFSLTGMWELFAGRANLLFNKRSITWNVIPGFSLPLIDFGALVAEKNQAKSQEKQALYGYEGSLIRAFQELETALSGVKASNEQIGFLEKEMSSLAYKTVDFEERYQVGLIDQTNLLESELEQLFLQETLLQAINSRLGFAIGFYKALGVHL